MNLRLLHPTLPVVSIKELKNCIERLLWIVQNIGKRSALMFFEEHLACDRNAWHFGVRFSEVAKIKGRPSITKFEGANIVCQLTRHAIANPREWLNQACLPASRTTRNDVSAEGSEQIGGRNPLNDARFRDNVPEMGAVLTQFLAVRPLESLAGCRITCLPWKAPDLVASVVASSVILSVAMFTVLHVVPRGSKSS